MKRWKAVALVGAMIAVFVVSAPVFGQTQYFRLGDNDELRFGDGTGTSGDVNLSWNGTKFLAEDESGNDLLALEDSGSAGKLDIAALYYSAGTLTLDDAVAVTGTLDAQGVISNSTGALTITDTSISLNGLVTVSNSVFDIHRTVSTVGSEVGYRWFLNNTSSAATEAARAMARWSSNTLGSETAEILFKIPVNGVSSTPLTLSGGGISTIGVTASLDAAINGGDVTTTATTATLFNTNATTLNIGGAATALTLGATTGTTTVRNALSVGANDTTAGNQTLYGDSSTGGARTHYYNSASEDTNTEFYTVRADADLAFERAGTKVAALDESDGRLKLRAGTGTGFGRVGGVLDTNVTEDAVASGLEEDLMSYAVPANTFSQDGDTLFIEGVFVNQSGDNTIKAYLGATEIASWTSGLALEVMFQIRIMKDGSGQKIYVENSVSGFDYTTASETMTGALTFKFTGEGLVAGDIQQETMIVEWKPAA